VVAQEASSQDDTGYECFINHLHIKNLAEALEFARQLKSALTEGFTEDFVVIVSFDGREATVRFHKHRAGEAWLNDNLEWFRFHFSGYRADLQKCIRDCPKEFQLVSNYFSDGYG
jgi:hypothetical protein